MIQVGHDPCPACPAAYGFCSLFYVILDCSPCRIHQEGMYLPSKTLPLGTSQNTTESPAGEPSHIKSVTWIGGLLAGVPLGPNVVPLWVEAAGLEVSGREARVETHGEAA